MFELETGSGVARLTLARPEARNAVPVAGWRELADRVAEAERVAVRLWVAG